MPLIEDRNEVGEANNSSGPAHTGRIPRLEVLDDGGAHLRRVDLGQVRALLDVVPDARLAGDAEGVGPLGHAVLVLGEDGEHEQQVLVAALAGGLNRLPRQIGPKRALGMILTGRHVGPEEGNNCCLT